jgi:hypothetical protein
MRIRPAAAAFSTNCLKVWQPTRRGSKSERCCCMSWKSNAPLGRRPVSSRAKMILRSSA